MYRNANTTRTGASFDEQTIEAVWNKGAVVPGYDPRYVRKDACGAFIERARHGETTRYGWEIDHVMPVAHGGPDVVANLQPLQWENNRHKSDNWPHWSCAISSN